MLLSSVIAGGPARKVPQRPCVTAPYHASPIHRLAANDPRYLHTDEGLIGEYDATGNQTRSYGYAPDTDWGTDPLFTKIANTYYYYHNDHLNTPVKLTAPDGTVVWSATYNAYGQAQIDRPIKDRGNGLITGQNCKGENVSPRPGPYYLRESYIEEKEWVVVPAESGSNFSEEDAQAIASAAEKYGYRFGFLVVTEALPAGKSAECYAVSFTPDALGRIRRTELALLNCALFSEQLEFVILGTVADYLLIAGSQLFVETVLKQPLSVARARFRRYIAEADYLPEITRNHLRKIAKRYGADRE